MSQTTDAVVSKTPERWRVLETEETAIPLVAHLARCRFFTTRDSMPKQRQVQVGE